MKTMQLAQALESIDAHGVFLYYDARNGVELFSSGRKLPIILRRSVFRYRSELEALMRAGAAVVCPSKQLHRSSWYYNRRDKQYYCLLCQQLEPAIRMNEQADDMAC